MSSEAMGFRSGGGFDSKWKDSFDKPAAKTAGGTWGGGSSGGRFDSDDEDKVSDKDVPAVSGFKDDDSGSYSGVSRSPVPPVTSPKRQTSSEAPSIAREETNGKIAGGKSAKPRKMVDLGAAANFGQKAASAAAAPAA